MFWCLPDGSKCEWRKLNGFVKQYNQECGVQYELKECLDISNNKTPQPEMRLKSHEEKDMVIEHKIIVWPPEYLQNHRVQHHFIDAFIKTIKGEFKDDVYTLELSTENILPKTRVVVSWARKIADRIIESKDSVLKKGSIQSVEPIPWTFRKLSDAERDDGVPERGVGVHFWVSPDDFDNLNKDYQRICKDVKSELSRHLVGCSKKFSDYKDCLRVFITEIYGEHLLLGHEIIENIVKDTQIPDNIDEIWVGFPEWIDNDTFETRYNKAFIKNDK